MEQVFANPLPAVNGENPAGHTFHGSTRMKNDDYWFPCYPVRWHRKTLHLTTEQRGAYRDLCDYYMMSGEPLSASPVALARISGLELKTWEAYAPLILKFFTVGEDENLHHKTCDAILADQKIRAEEASEHARGAARARWENTPHKTPKKECSEHARSNAQPMPGAMLNDATPKKNRFGSPNPLHQPIVNGIVDNSNSDDIPIISEYAKKLIIDIAPHLPVDNVIAMWWLYQKSLKSRKKSVDNLKNPSGSLVAWARKEFSSNRSN